jgi:hypothetical protein
VNKKISNIRRFLSLLLTDKDPRENDSSIVPEEVIPDFLYEDGKTHLHVTPDDIWPSEEIVKTTVFEEREQAWKTTTNIEQNKIEWIKKEITKSEQDPSTEQIILWLTNDQEKIVNLDTNALKRHMLIVGMTGSGKTTMMERMILQDIDAGRGVGLIDPHGDLYDKIVQQIPKSRSNDVVLFDLTDTEYPIWFNILENTHHQFPSLIASSIVGVFKKIFGYSWWPRLEYVLRNATLTLLEQEGSTLLDLTLLLSDEDFRKKYISKVKNPFLRHFWADEFNTLSNTKQTEVVSPILNKVGQFLSVPLIRNIVSQPQSGFSPRWIMDNKKIFLANLSKGKIWEDVSEMLGSLLVSKFQLDVMSRAVIEPEKREPFRLYVDEFQNFATDSFSDIFSEARKYGLALVIAHQYINQVPPQLMDAIMGNVGNMAVFHIGSSDAKILAPNIETNLMPQMLVEQPLYNFTLKTSKNGQKIVTHGELLHPDIVGQRWGLQNTDKLRNLVREKFATQRSFVEEKLDIKMS